MSLNIENVSLFYGATQVLRDCSLNAAQGELVCLVGPSGCGKTSLLNVIAGVVKQESGTVEVGGRDVGHLPTRERRLAFIMDRLGLYPHLNVFENIAYPLRLRKVPALEVIDRVTAACGEVGLAGFERRRPHQLSAGQQQRVAIARALVRDDAALVLADESFSSLDAQLRYELRTAFRRWQRDWGVTALFVTHDQEEALALGDRIALMREGAIEQIGTPKQLYDDPGTLFAARFFGIPHCNLVMAVTEGKPTSFLDAILRQRPDLLPRETLASDWILGFRPEAVTLVPPTSLGSVAMKIEWIEPAGPDSIVHLAGEQPIAVRVRDTAALAPNQQIGVLVQASRWMVFDKDTGGRIS